MRLGARARCRMVRRRFLLVALAGGAAALAGCGRGGVGVHVRAAPASRLALSRPVTVLRWQPFGGGGPAASAALVQQAVAAAAPFLASNPGLRLEVDPSRADALAAVRSGHGPDVVAVHGGGGTFDDWLAAGLLTNLQGYVQSERVDLSGLCAGQLASLSSPAGLFGLPSGLDTSAVAVNLGLLRTLRVSAPAPTWDWRAYAQLAARSAGPVGGEGHRFGTTIAFATGIPAACYFHGFGGALVDPADAHRCALGSAAAIEAGRYVYGLLRSGAAAPGRAARQSFSAGLQVAPLASAADAVRFASAWSHLQWDFLPLPRWPAGRYTSTAVRAFGVSTRSRHAAAAWTLVRWLCTRSQWQQAMVSAALRPPGVLGLWNVWLTQLRAAVPALAGKHLEAFALPSGVHALAPGGVRFAHADILTRTAIATALRRLQVQPQSSVAATFATAARAADSLQRGAAQAAAGATASSAKGSLAFGAVAGGGAPGSTTVG